MLFSRNSYYPYSLHTYKHIQTHKNTCFSGRTNSVSSPVNLLIPSGPLYPLHAFVTLYIPCLDTQPLKEPLHEFESFLQHAIT